MVLRRGIPVLLLPLLAACGTDDAGLVDPEPAGDTLVVTGTVDVRNDTEIPPDARVLVVWSVSATSPDYSYVAGEGELTDGGSGFRVVLEGPPPGEAMNADVVGVGTVVLTTNQEVGTGDDLESVSTDEILGAAGWYGVLYLQESMTSSLALPWFEDFPPGYNVGRGVERSDGFDAFEPVAPSTVVLVVDALENIRFVNWT